jgi:hypothetical protein
MNQIADPLRLKTINLDTAKLQIVADEIDSVDWDKDLMTCGLKVASVICARMHISWVLFRSEKFLDDDIVAFLFLFDEHCPIME